MSGDDAAARLRAAADGARAGDPQAFRALVAETHETVFRLAAALVSDRDEAADVTQETYVRAWGRIGELRDGAAALGWLCRIARNVAHDRRRSWWSRIRAPLDAAAREVAPRERDPDASLAAAERGDAVRAALARLPEKHRVVLALREIEGLSYGEIAAALGVPVGTVESRLHRARAALARRLAGLREEVDG
ncbi:MAG TPA: sigma-70 family RNA polymerase sigma factor [Anaeromyxobacter sp.]|nr:sigma-70 family RNA polymerase sigma factor [Anaeromyxobacter sp.]